MKEDQVASSLGIAGESRKLSIKAEGATFTSTPSTWRNGKGTIVVVFEGGEARDKHYYSPGTGPAPGRRNQRRITTRGAPAFAARAADYSASAIARPRSAVFALPPTSGVRGPSTSATSIASTIAFAASA